MDKKKIKSEKMTEISEYIESLHKEPKLIYLFVELTEQCNLACLHCGSDCEAAKNHHIDTDLLIKSLKELAEDVEPQTVMICLTGGEPFLHKDFYKIVETIVQFGFLWGITTNGTLIKQEDCIRLKNLGLNSVTISLDGLKDSHEWLRNVKGCFEKTLQCVNYFNDIDIPVQITSVIHRKNFHELEDMYNLMVNMKIASWRVINIEPIGRTLNHRDLLLTSEEIHALLDFIREKRYSINTPMDICFGCSHYLSFEYEHELRDNYFVCGSGIYVGSILYNGDIYSCLDIERRPELVQGNISNDRFFDVWKNKFSEFRRNRTELSERCRNCGEKMFCRGDSTHTWDFDKNEPMFCILREGFYL